MLTALAPLGAAAIVAAACAVGHWHLEHVRFRRNRGKSSLQRWPVGE